MTRNQISGTTFFDCFASESEITEKLTNSKIGTKHPYNGVLLEKTGSGIISHTIQQPSFYLSASSLDKVTQTIDDLSNISAFSSKFPFLKEYVNQMMIPNQVGSIKLFKDNVSILWGGLMNPTFFDAELFNQDTMNCYNKTASLPGWKHSGDITAEGYFIHSNTCTQLDLIKDKVFFPSAVGYMKTKLIKFERACPCMLLIDHENKVTNIIPFSLERSSLGDASLMSPLFFKVKYVNSEYYMHFVVLEEPILSGVHKTEDKSSVNTGDFPNDFKQKLREKTTQFDHIFNTFQHTNMPTELNPTPSFTTVSNKPQQSKDVMVLHQSGLPCVDLNEEYSIASFGNTLQIDVQSPIKSKVILPILTGEARGHPALALGMKSESTYRLQDWKEILNSSKLIIIKASQDGWKEPVMQASVEKVNGILIFYTDMLSTQKECRIQEMDNLSVIPCRIMGSQSLIIICSGGHYYYYKGSPSLWKNIVPIDISFGSEIEFDINKVPIAPLNILNIVPANDKTIWYSNQLYTASFFLNMLKSMPLKRLKDELVELSHAFDQLSVCLTSSEISEEKTKLRKILIKAIEESQKIQIAEIKELAKSFSSMDMNKDNILNRIQELRQEIKKIDRGFSPLIQAIETLCSTKYTSKKSTSKQELKRTNIIQSNVEDANKMKMEDIEEMLIETTEYLAIAAIDSKEEFTDLLKAISNSRISEYLEAKSIIEQNIMLPCPNCPTLDPFVVPSLLLQNDDHILATTGTQFSFLLQDKSCLIFPCFKRASIMDLGDYIDFMEEANRPEVARFRILLRGALTKLKLRIPIPPQSKELTFALQIMLLSYMTGLSRNMTLDTLEFTDSTCCTMRKMLYLWATTAASGKAPSTFAFQLIQPNSTIPYPSSYVDFYIFANIIYLIPFTKMNPLDKKVKYLLIRIIRKQIVDVVTEPMRKSMQHTKKEEVKDIQIAINITLQWNKAVLKVLHDADPTENKITYATLKHAATVFLKWYPQRPLYTTERLKKTLNIVLQDPTQVDWEIVRNLMLNEMTKRGAIFKPGKARAVKHVKNNPDIVSTKIEDNKLFIAQQLHINRASIKMQNDRAFIDKDALKMKGDAELSRTPWKISGIDIPNEKLSNELLKTALGDLVGIPENVNSPSTLNQIELDLAKVQKGNNAVKLIHTLHKIDPLTIQGVPAGFMQILFYRLNIDSPKKIVDDVILILIENWKDTVSAENKAYARVFNSTESTSTITEVS